VQRFEKGSVYWSEASRARAVFGAIGELYEAVGGTAGTLGFPRSDEGPTEALVDGKSGARQKFEGGSIYWHAERTAILIWGRFAEIYEADREIAVRLGFPKSAQVEQSSDRPRRWQRFDRGWLVSIDNGRPFPLVSSNSETLDEAAVNPRHTSDLGALHPSYALQNVLSDESIAIVIGTWVGAELLDRPVAAVLRDAIDRRGDSPFQRAVVVTDYRWFEEKDPRMRMRPAISVGGPDINSLAAEIVKHNGKHTFGEGWWSQSTSDQFERIALWGTGAPATRQVLESFMESPAMEQFLNRSWKRRF
jgi:hypothetical protein